MKKLGIAALALGALVTSFVTPAQAAPAEGPTGVKCGLNSFTDVTTEAGHQSTVLRGGPAITVEAGTLYCTIQVNQPNHGGTGVSLNAHDVGGVLVIPPTQVDYRATAADTVYLCAKFVPDLLPATRTVYYTSGTPTGTWSTNASAPCGDAAITIDPNPEACPFLLRIDQEANTTLADTWQDCGPYDPFDPLG